jgi:tetratricopeptide (TPR) repeat protein
MIEMGWRIEPSIAIAVVFSWLLQLQPVRQPNPIPDVMNPDSVSLCLSLVVKNESHQIDRCLASARDWVDEMLVLDTGSTDDTVEKARAYGARVEFFDWCNDFAAARNAALTHIAADWVLVLDADEWLLPDAGPAIRAAIAEPDHLVVNLVRREIGAVQSPYSLVSRLFRRHPEVRFDRPYHAIIDDSVMVLLQREPHWTIASLAVPAIDHDGYRLDRIASESKAERARAAMDQFWQAHPDDPYVCSKLGALLIDLGEVDQGCQLLKTGLQRAERERLIEVLYELHYHLAIFYSQQHQLDLARAHYRAALKQPVLPILTLGSLINLGGLYRQQGDLRSACDCYQKATRIDPNFAIAHYGLGSTLRAMNRTGEAITHYQRAIELDPQKPEFYQNLGAAFLKGGNVPESLKAFKQAIALYETQQSPEASRIRQTLQELGFDPDRPPGQ